MFLLLQVCAMHLGARVCALPASPALWSPRDDGVQERAHPGNIVGIVDVDRALYGINAAVGTARVCAGHVR